MQAGWRALDRHLADPQVLVVDSLKVVCVFTEWSKLKGKQERLGLVWTQALHWVAVLVAMNIMLLAGVRQLLPAPATSLVLPILLALGSFLAGVGLASASLRWSWRLPFRPSRGSNNPSILISVAP